MSDYIEREALLSFLCKQSSEAQVEADENGGESIVYAECLEDVITDIERIPAADVAPVRHGWWEKNEDTYISFDVFRCSECGDEWCWEYDDDAPHEKYLYCPHCGAKMDGGEPND